MKKILLFAYDGTGLGHLMRLIKIASGFSSDVKVLIVSGHKALPYVVLQKMDFCQIPNFKDELDKGFSEEEVNNSRKNLLWDITRKFQPAAFITDYLPLGKRYELHKIIAEYDCKKYFILRSNIGGEDLMRNDVFTELNINCLIEKYDRIFIASDPLISTSQNYDWLPSSLKEKMIYAGFVTFGVNEETVLKIRKKFLPPNYDKWFICSIGGGRVGGELLKHCLELAAEKIFSRYFFDIVLGYYNSENNILRVKNPFNNIRISENLSQLHLFHAAADYVICAGGYNTLLESMQGRKKIIFSKSVQDDRLENEQTQNIIDFEKCYNLHLIKTWSNFDKYIYENILNPPNKIYPKINMNGISNICTLIEKDLR